MTSQVRFLGFYNNELIRGFSLNWFSYFILFFTDIYLIFNKRTKEIGHLTANFSPELDGKILRANDLTGANPSLKAIAIVPAALKQYQHDLSRFTGYFRCKLDQLKLLRFETIVVSERGHLSINPNAY